MISGIIKVKVSVRLRLITITETLIVPDITKTESVNCLKENNDKRTVARNTICYFPTRIDFTTRELDIALGNHGLRSHSTDYSLIRHQASEYSVG